MENIIIGVKRYLEISPCVGLLFSYVSGLFGQSFAIAPLMLGRLGGHCWAHWLLFALGLLIGNGDGLHWRKSYRSFLRRESCSALIRCIVQEENKSGYRMRGVLRIKEIYYEGRWRPVQGVVQGIYPEALGIGSCVECQGALIEIPDMGGYNRWLKSQGIRHWFYPQAVKPLPQDWYGRYLAAMERCREALCQRLVQGIVSPQCRGMLCAMVFGVKGVLSSGTRDVFIRSASVHIFSVSGLHVGLVFGGLSLLLRLFGVPRWLRHVFVLSVVFCYVMLCGGYASALRAYFMLSLLVVTDLQERGRSPENTLGFAAILLLIAHPGYLLNSGFLYTFTLVGVLLRGRGLVKEISDYLTEKQHWLPPSRRWSYRMCGRGISLLAGGIVAWLGCCGLMMFFNQFVSFSAFGVNLAMIPMATLAVWGAMFKLLWNSPWLACVLETILNLMLQVSRLGSSGWYQSGACPGLAVVLLYYLGLVVFLCKSPWWIRGISLGVLLGILGVFCFQRETNRTIYSGGHDGKRGAVVTIDAYGRGTWLQPGGYSGTRNATAELQSLGVMDYQRIYVPYGSDYFALERLLEGGRVEEVIFEARALNSRKLRGLLPKIRGRGIHVSVQDEVPVPLVQPIPQLYP